MCASLTYELYILDTHYFKPRPGEVVSFPFMQFITSLMSIRVCVVHAWNE